MEYGITAPQARRKKCMYLGMRSKQGGKVLVESLTLREKRKYKKREKKREIRFSIDALFTTLISFVSSD